MTDFTNEQLAAILRIADMMLEAAPSPEVAVETGRALMTAPEAGLSRGEVVAIAVASEVIRRRHCPELPKIDYSSIPTLPPNEVTP